MLKSLLMTLFVIAFSAPAFGQNKSVYTDLAPDKCKTEAVNRGMPGNYIGKCEGVGGYSLKVYLDDERNSIGVVFPNNETVGLDFWNFFGGFSELGLKAEWRIRKQTPVALIVRLNVSGDDDEKKTSYLIITRIGPESACVTDIVKPGKNQNFVARRLADQASVKSCKEGRAVSGIKLF